MTRKTTINKPVSVSYEPLSTPITINGDTIYYLGINTKATGYEEVLVKCDLRADKATILEKVTRGDRKMLTILFIESKLHALIFDTSTIRCELVEISDDGDETLIVKFGKLDFGVGKSTDFYEAFNRNNWIYDKEIDSIFGCGAYYNYTTHQICYFDIYLSLKDGKTTLTSPSLKYDFYFTVN